MKNYFKFLILISILISNSSFACTCKKKKPVKEEYKRVAAILSGKIIAIANFTLEADPEKSKTYNISKFPSFVKKAGGKKYTVKLEKTFKGKFEDSIVTIYTGNSTCNYNMKLGSDYIIYGVKTILETSEIDFFKYPEKQVYWTYKCLRTRPYDRTEIEKLNLIID